VLEKAVLVTGSGRRIGFHLALRLHQDGYTVLAHYRTHTDEIQVLQDLGVETIQANFNNSAAILQFVEALKTRCTSFRALIHNASSFSATADDLAVAAEQYEQFFNVHMMAPFLINQGVKPLLHGVGGDPADIIHITDINVDNPTPQFDIYGTTKAGLHNMMLVLAKKFAPHIKVNAIAPGPVLFPKHLTMRVKRKILSETPLEKEGTEESVYLAIEGLLKNPFITGASIPVDGGRRLSKQ